MAYEMKFKMNNRMLNIKKSIRKLLKNERN